MPDYNNCTDNELASLLIDGDQKAYAQLYDRFKGILYVHAYRILQDREDAKDIVQELFTVLWVKRSSLVFKTGIASYLYTSVKNRVFDKISSKKVASRYFESLRDFTLDEGYSTDDIIQEKELSALIEKEIAALPDKMRQIFELSRKGNLSHKEIASQLVLSDKTVKKQVSNALRILRLKLGSLGSMLFTLL